MAGRVIECARCHLTKRHASKGMCAACYWHAFRRGRTAHKPRGTAGWRYNPERLAKLCELFATGITLSAIAKEFGVTKNTISGACWRNGLTCQDKHRTEWLNMLLGPSQSATELRFYLLKAKLDAAMALPVKRVPNTKGAVAL